MSQRFQFSLRSLFCLTAVVAVVVGTMSMLGRTQHFRALGSVHAYLALLPIVGVWAAWRYNLLTGRRTMVVTSILFTLSLPLPFLRLDGFIWSGAEAYLRSLISVFVGSDDYIRILSRTAEGWTGYCLITLANVMSIYAFVWFRESPAARDVRIVLRFISLASSLVALPLLCASNAIDNIYIGYGVWVAAMLAMWLGVREGVTCVSTFAGRTESAEGDRSSAIESPDARDSTAR